ncbi:MAG: heme peroxidase family protein [Fuerstiella sp.]
MFPGLPPLQPSDEALIELGRAMLEADSPPEGDTEIPAGMTYLGQFIDHDITLDLTEGLPTSVLDPTAIENGRTPGLDLDSVYGAGPGEGSNSAAYEDDGLHLTLGQTTGRDIFGVDEAFPNDLPRKPADDPECPRAAIIGDGRNDENLAVAQTHLAFLKFHNRIVDEGNHSFEDARRVARQHYQSIVLHDFLPRLVDPAVADDVATNGRKFFMPDGLAAGMRPCMPVEFSVAAYRLGHSMIRNEYEWNRVFSSTGPGSIATLGLVFEFSEVSTHRGIFTEPTVPSDWIIRWNSFHDFTGIGSISNHPQFNVVRRIDTVLAQKLDDLPEFKDLPPEQDFMKSLAARNLLRGKYLGLPSGQDVARAMGATPLTASEIREGEHASIIDEHRFGDATPLWYYILKEAEVQQDGQRLGEVGSRILLETFHALVEGSQDSILREENWGPTLASVDADRFTFADLLMFVDDINPIGD